MGKDFVWCADIRDGKKQLVYVDSVHYTNAMNRVFADCVVKGLPDSAVRILKAPANGRASNAEYASAHGEFMSLRRCHHGTDFKARWP
jgi:hypothetical protein|tara:strand:+ start:447 stop:710 length:264 start_codon:yes stop_codon:yes gene_type:complete